MGSCSRARQIGDDVAIFVVDRRENVLLVGRTGTGKSHIAQALGHRACRAGHQVLFVSTTDMLKQLRAARADGSHDRRLARFTGVDVLVLDDLGLKPLAPDEAADLYEVIRLRYRRVRSSSRQTGMRRNSVRSSAIRFSQAPRWTARLHQVQLQVNV